MKRTTILFFLIVISFSATSQISPGFKSSSLNNIPLDDDDTGNDNIFKTRNNIMYNYELKIIEGKEKTLKREKDDLYANSIQESDSTRYTIEAINKKLDSIEKLQFELKEHYAVRDSLYNLYVREYVDYKKVFVLNFGSKRSKAFFDILYDSKGKQFKPLATSGLTFGNQAGSIFSELVSGNLGVFRVSLGTMVSNSSGENSSEEENEEAYQRLVSYGGNTVLNLEYPLAYLHSQNKKINLISRLLIKGTADLPAFGTETESWAGSGSIGIDLYVDAAVDNDDLSFFIYANTRGIFGTSEFRENLGLVNGNFSFTQLSVGFTFLENFKVSFLVATLSSEKSLRHKNVVVGGQVMK